MRYAVPVKHLLLLLRADTVVFVQEIEERALGLLQRGVGAGFEVPQIGENAFFEFLRVLDWATEGLKAEGQASDDVGAGDVKQVVPGACQMVGPPSSAETASTYQSTQEM
jgi:hypothetical protein